jgi:hypothetical protein
MPVASVTNPREECLFCGAEEHVELFELWSDHRFLIETCCDGLHESLVREMADDPDWARALLRRLGVEAYSGHTLRRNADDGGCGMLLDWQLRIRPVTFAAARTFIDRHHTHCRSPRCWRFGAAVWNGMTLVGVALTGNPVARGFVGRGILEVNRLCIRRDIPAALRWNAASMLLGQAARTAEQQGWSRIITYTRADELATSMAAAGWIREADIRGRGWHGGTRQRTNRNAWIDKTRWGKQLHPRANVIRRPAYSSLVPKLTSSLPSPAAIFSLPGQHEALPLGLS